MTLRRPPAVVRPWRADELDLVVAAVQDPAIRRFSLLPDPFDRAEAERWFAAMPGDRAAGRALRLAIARAVEPRTAVGAVALFDIADGEAEIGYWLAAPARGAGLASAAVQAVVAHARDALGLRALRAEVAADNVASQRVLQGAGFVAAPGGGYRWSA